MFSLSARQNQKYDLFSKLSLFLSSANTVFSRDDEVFLHSALHKNALSTLLYDWEEAFSAIWPRPTSRCSNGFYSVVAPGGKKFPCCIRLRLTGCPHTLCCCLGCSSSNLLQYLCTELCPAPPSKTTQEYSERGAASFCPPQVDCVTCTKAAIRLL